MIDNEEGRKELRARFSETEAIRALLTSIGYPKDRLHITQNTLLLWENIFDELSGGILVDGFKRLYAKAFELYPGNEIFLRVNGVARDSQNSQPGPTESQSTSRSDTPHEVTIFVPRVSDVGATSELAFAVARELGFEIRIGYNIQDTMAFYLTGEMADARRLAVAIGQRLNAQGISKQVGIAPFKDYFFTRLTLEGPDQNRFELVDVPASTLAKEVADVFQKQYPTIDPTSTKKLNGSATLDNSRTGQRAVNDRTLHENGVQDGDHFSANFRRDAAMINPTLRDAALARARLQIEGFARLHPNCKVWTNANIRPTQYRFDIESPCWVLENSGNTPLALNQHSFLLNMVPDYPMAAPAVRWITVLFHPNVDYKTGSACLGELKEGWRPSLDMALILQMTIDMAAYRIYNLNSYYNAEARVWAASPPGQAEIVRHGGVPIESPNQDEVQPRTLKLRRL